MNRSRPSLQHLNNPLVYKIREKRTSGGPERRDSIQTIRLANSFVLKLANRYIGVNGGYLGDFSYRTHKEFYVEYCDVDINPDDFKGTTRERFIAILSGAEPHLQAKILRGVIQRFPVGNPIAPESRTVALREQIEATIRELERGPEPEFDFPVYNVEIVHRALIMNPLRNQASMAHPNEELLEPAEALLVINVSRSILHYLDTKLSATSTE